MKKTSLAPTPASVITSFFLFGLVSLLSLFAPFSPFSPLLPVRVHAAAPVPPSYQFNFSPQTGTGDNTGDGGGAGGYALQEYYVGQTFDARIEMNTGTQPVSSGDVQINLPTGYLSCTVVDGSVFESYVSQVTTSGTDTIYKITGYFNTPGKSYTGTAIFATLRCQVLQQREPMYGTTNPLPLDFYFLGENPLNTTDSNLGAYPSSQDILKSVESALIYLWPDTAKPYADGFNPLDGATTVSVNAVNPSFWFRDKNTTTGDETGVVTSTLQAYYKKITDSTYSTPGLSWSNCSGTWSTNQCQGTLAPTKIGNNRNFSYNTAYEICLDNGQDKAGPAQTPPGPNTMDRTCFTFTTEPDTDKPTLINPSPQTPAGVSDPISFTVRDVKSTNPSIYGTGLDPATIVINITGTKSDGTPFNETVNCASPGVVCTPVASTQLEPGHYGQYTVVYNPGFAYQQNSTTTVTVSGTTDYAGNTMNPYSWDFTIVDTTPPYIINIDPPPNSANIATGSCEINFEVLDDGIGVDIASLVVRVKDDFYQVGGANSSHISYTGDSHHYYVTIQPLFNICEAELPFGVTINVKDFSDNTLTPEELYALIDQTADQNCPVGCGLDGVCNPACIDDPDCSGPGAHTCAQDGVCDLACVNDPDCPNGGGCPGGGGLSCAADQYCNPDCVNDPDCPGGGNCPGNGGDGVCVDDQWCDPDCYYDPDCPGNGGGGDCHTCRADNFCDQYCLNDPDCPGNGGSGGGTCCAKDNFCDPNCAYDPDCSGGGGALYCVRDNWCNPDCKNDPDCAGGTNCPTGTVCDTCNNCAAASSCYRDDWCNPYCKNDPDCPPGTGSDSNCNNECPVVSCPAPYDRVAYRYVDLIGSGDASWDNISATDLDILCREANIQTSIGAQAGTDDQKACFATDPAFFSSRCQRGWWWDIIPWLIAAILGLMYFNRSLRLRETMANVRDRDRWLADLRQQLKELKEK